MKTIFIITVFSLFSTSAFSNSYSLLRYPIKIEKAEVRSYCERGKVVDYLFISDNNKVEKLFFRDNPNYYCFFSYYDNRVIMKEK